MNDSKNFLTTTEKSELEKTIAQTEKETTGEIVVAITDSSGRYDRSEDIFGFIVGILALLLSHFYLTDIQNNLFRSEWTNNLSMSFPLFDIFSLILGFIAGTSIASYFPAIAAPFISKKEIQMEIERKSHEIFSRERISKTKDSTGILILISLREHIVKIQPDTKISEKIDQSKWDEICLEVLEGIKNNNPANGLKNSIKTCGKLLSEHFPASTESNPNELTNHIRIYSDH